MQEEDATMNDASQGGSASTTRSSDAVNPPAEKDKGSPAKSSEAKEIDFENEDFIVSPSFSQELSKESLTMIIPSYYGPT